MLARTVLDCELLTNALTTPAKSRLYCQPRGLRQRSRTTSLGVAGTTVTESLLSAVPGLAGARPRRSVLARSFSWAWGSGLCYISQLCHLTAA